MTDIRTPKTQYDFNPRSPRGERHRGRARPDDHGDISIHAPPRGATLARSLGYRDDHISIHAPHTGSDSVHTPDPERGRISIHAPRRGSDAVDYSLISNQTEFQSTLPAGGATQTTNRARPCTHDFNPRSPQGERPVLSRSSRRRWYFNPRSPHGERPTPGEPCMQPPADFNPRSPRGERRNFCPM